MARTRVQPSSAPGGVMTSRKTGALAALLATLTVVVAIAAATAAAATKPPIVIGWAFDGKGNMAPFDGPALAAANVRVKQINATRRGHWAQAADHHLRHPGQRSGEGEVVRREPDRQGRADHVRHLRRRLRDTRRAGGDQPRDPRGRTVHRHRPDGPEALRREGQARLQLRQRRAGRGIGDGRVRVEAGLEERRARHRTRCSSTSRTSSRRSRPGSPSSAARSSRRRATRPGPTT